MKLSTVASVSIHNRSSKFNCNLALIVEQSSKLFLRTILQLPLRVISRSGEECVCSSSFFVSDLASNRSDCHSMYLKIRIWLRFVSLIFVWLMLLTGLKFGNLDSTMICSSVSWALNADDVKWISTESIFTFKPSIIRSPGNATKKVCLIVKDVVRFNCVSVNKTQFY